MLIATHITNKQDCALLAPCPACAQVVEVAGMPEHLLDECDQKANYVSCDVTGEDDHSTLYCTVLHYVLFVPCCTVLFCSVQLIPRRS